MSHGGDIYSNDIQWDFSVNLNPLPCPESIRRAIGSAVQNADKYPDAGQNKLRLSISKCENIEPERILGGNGASELIMAAVKAIAPSKVLLPMPGFTGYKHAVDSIRGCTAVYYDMHEYNGFILTDQILDKIDTSIQLVIITNPNNPTGRTVSEGLMDSILKKCRQCGCALLIDESFLRMSSAESFAHKTYEYDDLYILSGYTKLFSVPGIRVGYIITSPDNIFRLKAHLPEWNMSVIAQECAAACAKALLYTDFQERTLSTIQHERKYLKAGLEELGLKVYDSDTSFMLVKSRYELCRLLKSKKILIRSCEDFGILGDDIYRIAVKNREQNDILIDAVKEIVSFD